MARGIALMIYSICSAFACLLAAGAGAQVTRIGPHQELTAPRPAGASTFAASGSSNGEWIAIDSQHERHARDPHALPRGAVHLFRDEGGAWRRTQSLWAPSSAGTSSFGRAIAFGEPGELFVGMHNESTNGFGAGALFRYELRGDSWNLAGRLDSPLTSGLFGGSFGRYVSFRDGRLLVVAPDYKEVSSDPYGRLFTYEQVGLDWTLVSILEPPVGSSPASHFDGIVDGGEHIFIPTKSPRRVLVYTLVAGTWTLVQTIPDPSPAGSSAERFGEQIAYSDEGLAIANSRGSTNNRPGVVYLYENIGGQWTRTQTLRSGSTQTDRFGTGLALHQNRLLVGVPLHHYNVVPGDAPSAWLYEKQMDGEWIHSGMLESELPRFQAAFGNSVAIGEGYAMVGDVFGGVAASENAGTMSVYTLPIGRSFCSGVGIGGQPAPMLSLTGAIYSGCESVTAAVTEAGGLDLFSVYSSLRFRDNPALFGPHQGTCLGGPCFLSASPQLLSSGESGSFECALAGLYPTPPISGATVAFQAVFSGIAGSAISNAVAVTIP